MFASIVFAASFFSTARIFAKVADPTTPATTATPAAGATATPTSIGDAKIGVGVGIPETNIGSGGSYSFADYIRAIYSFAMKAAVVLATLMVIFAGYKYLTSRGETGAINEAKDILFSTLMGAALLMLVVLVANIAGINTSLWNSSSTGALSTQTALPATTNTTGTSTTTGDVSTQAKQFCAAQKPSFSAANWENGPCLSNNINNTGYAVDVAHNPRQAIDDQNTCSSPTKWVELDTSCSIINVQN